MQTRPAQTRTIRPRQWPTRKAGPAAAYRPPQGGVRVQPLTRHRQYQVAMPMTIAMEAKGRSACIRRRVFGWFSVVA